jgi:hypothetical protein
MDGNIGKYGRDAAPEVQEREASPEPAPVDYGNYVSSSNIEGALTTFIPEVALSL